jgi:2-keto-3-deoxy-L-rhamnonate aldolase RhmA
MPTQIGENRAKKMLKANELVLCMGVNQLRTPNIAMIAAACGFDAVYIDLEHNPTSLETAAAVCVAALGMGITPIARVTSHDAHDATRILDCGAQGVMVPHVQNAAEAGLLSKLVFMRRRATAQPSAAVPSSAMPPSRRPRFARSSTSRPS